MVEFEHALITRFNLKTLYSSFDTNDSTWLDERFELFERFCFPSVKNQTNQLFRWYILYDTNLPIRYKNKLVGYTNEMRNLHPIFLEKFDKEVLSSLISQDTKADFLISTRLDSDDSIENNFIQCVQDNFDSQDFSYLNFLNGYEYVLDKGFNKLNSFQRNPFMSLIEKRQPNSNYYTIYKTPHDEVDRSKVHNLKSSRWCINIHGGNVINSEIGRPLFFWELDKCKSFNFEFTHKFRLDQFFKYTRRFVSKRISRVL